MKKVLIDLNSKSLGDTLCALPYVDVFRKSFNVDTYFKINLNFKTIIEDSYNEINYVSGDENILYDKVIIIKWEDAHKNIQENIANQLGILDWTYIKPNIEIKNISGRPIKNKYVTIGIHSTLQMKYWNHPLGKKVQFESPYWSELCKKLRKSGYTPVIIEKDELFGVSPFWNGHPKQSLKKLGLTLNETINYIYHSEFFIGLSSGLSWLAHSLGTKVAMISNFTEDWYEFDLTDPTYKRIINKNVCHGCFNDKIHKIYGKDVDWYWCPKHKNTNRQFECHTSITPEMVYEEIKEWLI